MNQWFYDLKHNAHIVIMPNEMWNSFVAFIDISFLCSWRFSTLLQWNRFSFDGDKNGIGLSLFTCDSLSNSTQAIWY